jgi:hypothetical protein
MVPWDMRGLGVRDWKIVAIWEMVFFAVNGLGQ